MGGAGTPPLAPGLFTGGGAALTLRGGRSRSTGLLHFPLAPVCPYTGADDVEETDLPRRGTLWAWTTVHTSPAGYHGPVPYGLGVVELAGDDGPAVRVVGRVGGADPGALAFGLPMEVAGEVLPDGDGGTVETWCFVPVAPR